MGSRVLRGFCLVLLGALVAFSAEATLLDVTVEATMPGETAAITGTIIDPGLEFQDTFMDTFLGTTVNSVADFSDVLLTVGFNAVTFGTNVVAAGSTAEQSFDFQFIDWGSPGYRITNVELIASSPTLHTSTDGWRGGYPTATWGDDFIRIDTGGFNVSRWNPSVYATFAIETQLVPEPASATLLVMGVAGLLARRRSIRSAPRK